MRAPKYSIEKIETLFFNIPINIIANINSETKKFNSVIIDIIAALFESFVKANLKIKK